MGTVNFAHPINVSQYYVIDTDDFEVWDFDDLESNLNHALQEYGADDTTHSSLDSDSTLHNRSYPMKAVGVFDKYFNYGDIEIPVEVVCYIQSGYYSGISMDYAIYVDGDRVQDDLEDHVKYFTDDDSSSMNSGLRKVAHRILMDKIQQYLSDLHENIETVYKEWSSHRLKRQGVMSNGVAVYRTV